MIKYILLITIFKGILMNYIPYTYRLKWTKLNLNYYGSRTAKNCCPEDLWESYFSSSKYVKNITEIFGNPDIIEIRKTFKTKKEALDWEYKVLKRLNVMYKNDWLNNSVGGGNFYLKEGTYIWVNDGEIEYRQHSYLDIPNGFKRGRLSRKWFHKGEKVIMVVKSPGNEWKRGRPSLSKNNNPMFDKSHKELSINKAIVKKYKKVNPNIPFEFDENNLEEVYDYVLELYNKFQSFDYLKQELKFSEPTIKNILVQKGVNIEDIKTLRAKEVKKKRKKQTGNKNFLGKSHTQETKEKMSLARKKYWKNKKENS